MAVRVGFEPTEPAKVQRFSRPPDSTALAPHRRFQSTWFEGHLANSSGANGEGRTPMALRPLEPKSSASASSATFANRVDCSHFITSRSHGAAAAAISSASKAGFSRGALRPQPQGAGSTAHPAGSKSGHSMCRPQCASHSAASRVPFFRTICSKIGTRNMFQRRRRCCSVNRASPGHASTITAWVSGNASAGRQSNWSQVAATAAGRYAAASCPHPRANTRTAPCERNHGASTAVGGAGGIG